jgi:hypothetical protein
MREKNGHTPGGGIDEKVDNAGCFMIFAVQ